MVDANDSHWHIRLFDPLSKEDEFENMTTEKVKNFIEKIINLIASVSGIENVDALYYVKMHKKKDKKYRFEVFSNHDMHTAMVTPKFPVLMTVFLNDKLTVSKCKGTLCSPFFSPIDGKSYLPKEKIEICSVPALADFLFLHLCVGFTVARTFSSLIEVVKKIDPQIDCNVTAIQGKGFYFSYDDKSHDDKDHQQQRRVAHLAIDPTDMSLCLTSKNNTESEKQIQMDKIIPVTHHQKQARTEAWINFDQSEQNTASKTAYKKHFSREDGQLYIEHNFGKIKPGKDDKTEMHPTIKNILGLIFEILMFGNFFKETVGEGSNAATF